MITSFQEVADFIKETFANASNAADGIFQFSEGLVKNARIAASLAKYPRYENLELGGGKQVWAAVLYTDLRNSSNRAIQLGPRATFISMHCLLAGLAYLVTKAGGTVSNFRGDGLFGLFGLGHDGSNPPDLNAGKSVQRATNCGMAMIEMLDDMLNPLLESNDIEGDLRIGVGVDHGDVVVTRIGLIDANEITPYGPPVNHAAKFCGGNGNVYVSDRVKAIFPMGKGGKVTFDPVSVSIRGSKRLSGYKVKYPKTLHMLERPAGNEHPVVFRK
jgi:adenylate cyclase